ncbi:sialidase-3-like isoform X2 [Sphaerodactylus townsendi]|uniref:sialidase-3-like isoform X2 n=1 Tax=Sphaerodactylus townsendi TaxID=933632 RepID=UPI0020266A79|nr:sialidase-3-like isoform X2 [Sphaerodactylus townsendi]
MKRSAKPLPIAHLRILHFVGFLLNTSVLPENMAEAQTGSRKTTLFHQEASGGVTYRIPALLFLPNQSVFLAFAEKRSSPKDEHAKYLVMRRGQKEGTSVQWGPPQALVSAMIPGHRTMNPCPVYEKETGRVFLFFICVQSNATAWHQIATGRNAARLGSVSSQDGGHTWSWLTDLTDRVIGDNLRNWATFAVGPGHGLQLRSGRLVIPAYAYYIRRHVSGKPAARRTRPHCFTVYSDDGGRNWTRGQLVPGFRTEECQVAELTRPDHSQVLYCNARSPKYRVAVLSTNGGNQFETPFLSKKLPETRNGCQGSVVSFSPALKPSETGQRANPVDSTHPLGVPRLTALNTTKEWLLFSHPMGRRKRVNLGIYLNTAPLANGSWKAPWVLHEGPSGYSDLAVCRENHTLLFGCLFESGLTTEYEEIAFRLFTVLELLNNTRGNVT